MVDVNAVFDIAAPIRAVAERCATNERSDILLPRPAANGEFHVLQETHCINLGGLAALLGRSRLSPSGAERFRCWMRDTVLFGVNRGDSPFDGAVAFYLDLWPAFEFAEYALLFAEDAAVCGDPVLEDRAALLMSCVDWDAVEAAGGERL